MRRECRCAFCGLALAPLLLLLAACSFLPRSGGYFEDDGPSAPIADAARIPDAVPRHESRSRYGNNPYTVNGATYRPLADGRGYRERGVASWYGKKFHGRRTSNGETYDMYAMTAAHTTLPLPSYVRVRNLKNGRSVVVRVNDRGPFLHSRLIDLSYAAAAKLGIADEGTGLVEVETVGPGEPLTAKTETVEVIAPAAAAEANGGPRLYLQVGAFTQWDNAIALRDRLEREAFRPIFVQSTLAEAETRVYRVRIGPVASVEEGDRLTERLAQQGVANAVFVVE